MTTPPRRLVSGDKRDDDVDASLRPQKLAEFVGQEKARANLSVFIEAAKARGEALDHVLFVGPPGLGKTTLAQIVAREMGVNFRSTSGPVIAKAGDLAALLTNLEPRDVLFIDEIHRLNPHVEEILYPAMEDFQLDLIIGEGPAARSVKIDLAPFTLVGATTRAGLLTNPLRDRFGIPIRLNFYTEAELELIVARGARVLGLPMTPEGLKATKQLSAKGVKTNVTLIFTPMQALLAAKAGATYVSPFVGRLDDISQDGMGIIEEIRTIFDNYGYTSEIIVASIRNPIHVLNSALIGADICTIPYSVMLQLSKHPLTDAGIKKFLEDWEKVPK